MVTINDDDAGGQVQFAAVATAGAEGAPATVTVTRKGGSASGVSVNYATGGGTATAGADYTAAAGTLVFGPSQTSRTFTVTLLSDALIEGTETIGLSLSAPSGGAALGSPVQATLYVVDDDP